MWIPAAVRTCDHRNTMHQVWRVLFFLSFLIGKNGSAPQTTINVLTLRGWCRLRPLWSHTHTHPQMDQLSLINGCSSSDWGFLQPSIRIDGLLSPNPNYRQILQFLSSLSRCLPLFYTSFHIHTLGSSQSSSNPALHKSLPVCYFALLLPCLSFSSSLNWSYLIITEDEEKKQKTPT